MKKFFEKNKVNQAFSVLLITSAVAFSGVILVREGSKIPWQNFHLNIGLVILSLIISTIGYIPAFICWKNLLSLYHIQGITVHDLRNFVYTMLGSILPGGVWQLIGRSVLYSKQEGGSIKVAAASGLEVIIIGAGAWLVYLLALFHHPGTGFIQLRVSYQILLLVPVFFVLEPHILERLNAYVIKKLNPNLQYQRMHFPLLNVISLLLLEILTIVIGGIAMFVFLNSIVEISTKSLIPIIAAYSFSIAVANLLFWVPGRMIVKDGALTVALAQFIPLGMSVIFVILIRLWTIFTILVPAGLVWVAFVFFDFLQRKRSIRS